MERRDVDQPSEQTAEIDLNAALTGGTDPALVAAIDDAVIGDVLADLPEAQPGRTLHSATDFSSLYVRHRHGMEAHARRYLRDARDVDEVVQETFLRLFLAIGEIETELQAIAFARRTLTNLCIDRYRADRRRPTLITLDVSPLYDVTSAEEEPDPVLQAEDAAIVRDALSRLSPLHRAALVKREIEEKPLPQIAAELGVAEESVKHLLFRARRALRRLLAGTSVEPGADLDGVPRQVSPLVRGAGVIIFFLVGALVVATGVRPLFSGGGHARPSTDAIGGGEPLNLTGPDTLPGKTPKVTHHHHKTLAKSTDPSASSGLSTLVQVGGTTPPATHRHHPVRHAPIGGYRPHGHFALSGPLKVTGTPSVTQGGVSDDGNGNRLTASSFSAPTDHGTFALDQSVRTSSDGGATVAVTPSFVVGGTVEQPELAGSTAAVGTDAAGNVTVDVTQETKPDSGDAFPLTSVTARFVLSADLSQVVSETVTLSTKSGEGSSPVSAGGGTPPPSQGTGNPDSGSGTPQTGGQGTSAPGSSSGSTPGAGSPASPPPGTGGSDTAGPADSTGVTNKPA